MKTRTFLVGGLLYLARVRTAHAQIPAEASAPAAVVASRSLAANTPVVGYTYHASGARNRMLGVQAYGGTFTDSTAPASLTGGGLVWGSPFERLTLLAEGQRTLTGDFKPAAGAIIHVATIQTFSIGVLGRLKLQGFAAAPGAEVESEAELGALLSLASGAWFAHWNGIMGKGLDGEGETDVESRLRLGRQFGSWVQFGIDTQLRKRLIAPKASSNGPSFDFAAGLEVAVGDSALYAVLTTGPSSIGREDAGLGWASLASVGGCVFGK